MPEPLIVCIPNFSEGRDERIVQRLIDTIAEVDGVHVLHQTHDADHNRCVITFAGRPDDVLVAAYRAVQQAAELIDMEMQHGVHPRLGATDVVPLVPMGGLSMDECVQVARRLGERIGSGLGLPVYLYEYAALRPERHLLADVRRGQYELLKEEIHTPQRAPDYGPAVLGKAGAVIVGARKPLVAYNVFLQSDDVAVAKEIAVTIRESSGGMPAVRAMGVLVNGLAQVSMNLVDYETTGIYDAFDAVEREAAARGVMVHSSELIGLIPRAAIAGDVARLKLIDFSPDRVLENRLADVGFNI